LGNAAKLPEPNNDVMHAAEANYSHDAASSSPGERNSSLKISFLPLAFSPSYWKSAVGLPESLPISATKHYPMKNSLKIFALAVAGFSLASATHGIVINYTDLNAFNSSVGAESIIRFTEVAEGVTVGSQYANLGVLFTDLNDTTLADTAFLSDGFGLNGHGVVTLQFSSYLTAMGALFPGAMTIQLLSDGSPVGTTAAFGGQGEGFFGGVISDIPFNGAILSDWSDSRVFVDNLYFNAPTTTAVPDAAGTGTLLVIGVAVLAASTRFVRREPERSLRRT
jgi:hypothetical protein